MEVNKFVRDRALKCKNSEIPVKCGEPNKRACANVMRKKVNMQQTVSKCFRDVDQKEVDIFGFDRESCVGKQLGAPKKFFCLPFFNSQDEPGVNASPRRLEDAAEFLFVELDKFLARNSTSVLHNVIFCLFIDNKTQLDNEQEQRLSKWLTALGVNHFSKYVADSEFHTSDVPFAPAAIVC